MAVKAEGHNAPGRHNWLVHRKSFFGIRKGVKKDAKAPNSHFLFLNVAVAPS